RKSHFWCSLYQTFRDRVKMRITTTLKEKSQRYSCICMIVKNYHKSNIQDKGIYL
ncbi:unnamed protein product, partial [Musa textilis]